MALANLSTAPAIINLSRRQLFAAAPALAFLPAMAVAMPVISDPVIGLCRQYHMHDVESKRLMDAVPPELDCNTPEVEAMNDLKSDIYRTLSRMVPTTLEGIAAMAGVLVAEDVTWSEESYYGADDWIKANMAKGARALIG